MNPHVLRELHSHPFFQRHDVGEWIDLMMKACSNDRECVIAFATTDHGRQIVRSTPKLANVVFDKMIEWNSFRPLDVEFRQLFPSAPPIARCVAFKREYCRLPLPLPAIPSAFGDGE